MPVDSVQDVLSRSLEEYFVRKYKIIARDRMREMSQALDAVIPTLRTTSCERMVLEDIRYDLNHALVNPSL